jgi:hypothetical protein
VLRGEHVVRLLDYVEAPGQGAAIVMELVNGARNAVTAGGVNGWTATLEQPPSIIDYSPPGPGRLVASLGTSQVAIADNVTTFSWNLSGGAGR